MSEVPEITDREAAVLRFAALYRDAGPDRTESYCDDLASQGLVKTQGGITDRGRETLDAHDARKTARIRIEAMRDCLAVVDELDSHNEDHSVGWALQEITERIEARIAKEETRT